MMTELMVLAALLGGPVTSPNPDEALKAVQELYHYSTHSVQVEATELHQMLARIEQHLDSPTEPVKGALEGLAAEIRQDPPDGRTIRVAARDLYRALEAESGG